jgi:hypothetical protein
MFEATGTLNRLALRPFLDEVREERVTEIERIATHVDTSLTELLAKADEEIGRAHEDKEQGIAGAEGRLAQAENRHGELLTRRERRRDELSRQRGAWPARRSSSAISSRTCSGLAAKVIASSTRSHRSRSASSISSISSSEGISAGASRAMSRAFFSSSARR